MNYPKTVRLVEVGPRDGLQNEAKPVPVAAKVALIDALSAAGHSAVEAGSFVSPKWVPQMANTDEVMARIQRKPGVSYPVLVPNKQGMNGAVEAQVDEIAIFTAASEAFCRKNTNCSIDESFERFAPVMEAAQKHGMKVRGYVSTVIACPYDGKVSPAKVGGGVGAAVPDGLLRGLARRHDRRRHARRVRRHDRCRGREDAAGEDRRAFPRHLRPVAGQHPGGHGARHRRVRHRGRRASAAVPTPRALRAMSGPRT